MSMLLSPALDLLVPYAERHRDRRNIATHVVGVPLVVVAASVLLAHPAIEVAGWVGTPAWVIYTLAAAWYLTRGAFALGAATGLGLAVLVVVGQGAASDASVASWLGWGMGLLGFGGGLLLLGHYYEGRRPAKAGHLVALLVAPLFVTLELLGAVRPWRHLFDEVERLAAPTTLRDLAQPAAR